jgi:hypothetical protein
MIGLVTHQIEGEIEHCQIDIAQQTVSLPYDIRNLFKFKSLIIIANLSTIPKRKLHQLSENVRVCKIRCTD